MERRFRQALWRVAMRVIGWRFSRPIARVAGAAAGLWFLAFFGRDAVPGALGASQSSAAAPASIASVSPERPVPATPTSNSPVRPEPAQTPPNLAAARASSDDPVILNTAAEAELRRLPGIGAKRALAILALRARLGRFRAVEDLLKVKGIGRAMLKRLRPLVRLDPPTADAGAPHTSNTAEIRAPVPP